MPPPSPVRQISSPGRGFSLVELLVVIAIIMVLTALAIPAISSLKNSASLSKSSYDIAGAFDAARAYAIANSTYVWVGLFEEDLENASPATPRQAGTGRIVLSTVASAGGTRYQDALVDAANPPKFDNAVSPRPAANPVTLIQLGKLLKIENAHLVSTASGPTRAVVEPDYRVGDDLFGKHPPSTGSGSILNPTTFTYPLTGTARYVFDKIIEFNPRGEASKILDFPARWLEIYLQPTRGNVPDTNSKNVVVIQIAGVTGQTEVYRP